MKLIVFLIKSTFLISFLISIALGSITVYSLHDTPLVAKPDPLSPQQVKRVKKFIQKNDPALFVPGKNYSTSISESQLNLIISHTLAQFHDRLRVKTRLFNNSLYITSSLKLPANPAGHYLNITTELKENASQIIINSLKVGDIEVPVFIASLLLKLGHDEMSSNFIEYKYAINSIIDFKLLKKRIFINYIWNPANTTAIKNRIASSVISYDLRQRIVAYTQHLTVVNRLLTDPRPSLTMLLQPMFKFAIERSKNNNPVEENRALFMTLGAHMLRKNIPLLMGNRNIEHIPHRDYFLHNRNDLSKHFLISSAITAIADPAVAQAIGLEKEFDDSEGGSGFSFADLAADHAGVALANIGLASREQAQLLQQSLANTQNESDFMPSIDNLKEGLQHINFTALYKNTNSKKYKNVIRLINKRIAACTVHQI